MSNRKSPRKTALAEIRRVRSLWYESQSEDPIATENLLAYIRQYKTADAFVRHFILLKMNASESKPVGIKNQKKTPTAWERGQNNFRSGRITVLSGGLPSLGRKSK